MQALIPLAEQIADVLTARRETVSVAESSTGGLICAAMLAVPGASAYFVGGAVVYTAKARVQLMAMPKEMVAGLRSASEPYALSLARQSLERMGTTWAISETGAAGPNGNPYGDAAGHTCIAIAGPIKRVVTLETGETDRGENMRAFAAAALRLLLDVLEGA